jgi:maltose O-acetyltransferase
LFLIAYNYNNSLLKEFLINEINCNALDFSRSYNHYRKKFNLQQTFKFNGMFILFYGDGEIRTGENSYVGDYSTVYAHIGHKVVIGNNVRISHNVRIYTHSTLADQDFSKKPLLEKTGDVIIDDYAWIGANVFINPGVRIGRNAVVGANSVVTKDIPDNTIYGGVPAKLIKNKTI